MRDLKRRTFLKAASLAGLSPAASAAQNQQPGRPQPKGNKRPGRIPNEYSLLLPGEDAALRNAPAVRAFGSGTVQATVGTQSRSMRAGDDVDGWVLLAIAGINGTATAIFEKHVTHQGAIVYITESEGVIARIPKGIGELSSIRPRPTNTPDGVKLERGVRFNPGPDVAGNYILNSAEDPCYENVAALGAEYIGWTLVGNEQAGALKSLFIAADGVSRQLGKQPEGQAAWAPDLVGALFDPSRFLPGEYQTSYRYLPGYSKRTLLGGYLPVADTGVWNPMYKLGYEVMVLLPSGEQAEPMARIRIMLPETEGRANHDGTVSKDRGGVLYLEQYWNASAESFFSALAGVWNRWHDFFEHRMPVEIPDPWLLDAARAGITLSRCSYRGLEPTYQVGEGAYTKIPERSHALFPVAHYEFVWVHQLWNLTEEVDPYYQHYLEHYVLPDGNFLYNTQDQVEAPLNVGIFLANTARAYAYTGDLVTLQKKLPVLRRMIDYVLRRYEYSKTAFPADDPHHGLIWGSPEADLGDPQNDYPESHPYYFQNAAWTWRGLTEYSRCLAKAAAKHNLPELDAESKRMGDIAVEMRAKIERSLRATIQAGNSQMRAAGITPFSPDDIHRRPNQLSSYENHRFMMDWFTADWGDAALDRDHLKHRELAGLQIIGLHTDGDTPRTSNFMEHGTLAVRIRQDDYRPFLLTLYALACYAADSGNRYAPEDAYIPGSYPGEGSPYGWSAVVNSVLQPSLGLRWLLCYEENDRDVCHLQKAAPKHWFASGEKIRVSNCPTRFGPIGWTTQAASNDEWRVRVNLPSTFPADLVIHVHPPDRRALKSATVGQVASDRVTVAKADLAGKTDLTITIR
jgi:hypothetical protein